MHDILKRVEHVLEHAATVMLGIVLVVLGLAMTFSVVFAVPGIFVLLIGAALVVGGFFTHPTRRARRA